MSLACARSIGRPDDGPLALLGTETTYAMLFQFTTTGNLEREQACESFELLLRTLHQILLHQRSPLSLELGVKDGQVIQGFRAENEHVLRALKNALRNVFPSSQLSSLPEEAFVPNKASSTYFADVELGNDLFPIQRWQELLTQSDPLATLLGALAVNDHARCFGHLSIVITPLSARQQHGQHDALRILEASTLSRHKTCARWLAASARSQKPIRRLPSTLLRPIINRSLTSDPALALGSARHLERETDLQAASNKLSGPCFAVTMRIRVFGPPDQLPLATSLIHQTFAPLAQFNAPRRGQFKLGSVTTLPQKHRPSFILNCHELSSIFHPPCQRTETLATSRLVQLEPPRQLPLAGRQRPVMKLGQTCFHSHKKPFGLHDADSSLHGFVTGSSGSGKTTLLTSAIKSLIERGQGITLVDFHGDFAKSIEAAIPRRYQNQLVRFCPSDDSPLAFNPLYTKHPERWPILTDAMVSGMRNLFGHSWGPRLEMILQMSLSAAIAAQQTTLADVRRMLEHEPTRVNILSRVSDKIVRQFWFETYASWDKRYRTESIQSVLNKLDALLTPKLRAMLCQTGPSFDFREAFDQNKIVVVNLARGQMGLTAASTLGSLVLSAIQNAALSRADIPETSREPHTVFLDELQLYSNPQALMSLMAEARKYRVSVWSATQALGGLDRETVLPIILANAANFISFRVSQQGAVEIAPILDDAVTPKDLVSLPRFHAYARVMVEGEVQAPFSFTTIKP